MRNVRPGMAGALLVGIALLAGTGAMWTVDDEPAVAAQASGQANGEEAAQVEAATAQPAASEQAEAQSSPAAVTSETGLEGVLRILATGGPVPNEVRDPAFDYYVDLSLLGTAWVDLDAALLTDLALQFLEGERVLRRSHRAVPASEIANIAARLAIIKNDQETLARLEAAIQETGDEELSAALKGAKTELADIQSDATWSVPVATTSALEFAHYKGMLQDIEAAVVVRDRDTLQELEIEVQDIEGLPEAQRSRLSDAIKKAVAQLPADEQLVSETASVLDKLAHASRSYPRDTTFNVMSGGTQTIYPSFETQCTAVQTQCQPVETQCQAVETRCQSVETQCQSVETQCQSVETQCQSVETQCQSVETQCQSVETQCQSVETQCQPMQTQCQPMQTQCQPMQTQCQPMQTQCQPMQTQCQPMQTQCQPMQTQCQPMQTQCQPRQTQCQPMQTQCQPMQTQCQPVQTQCQPRQTQCQPVQTQCQAVMTQCRSMPTQCSATQKTKSCGKPTLFPEVPTRCPAILTRCPQSPTYCPSTCGQQQQKQRWIPSKQKPPGGSYQQQYGTGTYGSGTQTYPASPYRRRYDYDLGR